MDDDWGYPYDSGKPHISLTHFSDLDVANFYLSGGLPNTSKHFGASPHFSIPRPSGSPFASGRGPWVNRPAISELFLEFQMLHNDEQKPGDKDPLVWCFLFYYNSSPGVPSWSPSNLAKLYRAQPG